MSIQIGDTFGRLTVLDKAYDKYNGPFLHTFWTCMCECGNRTIVRDDALMLGNTTSCGCLNREAIIKARTTHGQGATKLYHKWYSMHQKCENPKNSSYSTVGGAGIRVCSEWSNPDNIKGYEVEKLGNPGFINFYNWAMENYPEIAETQQLQRIDITKDYSPDNCYFKVLKSNNRDGTPRFISDGEEVMPYRQFDAKYNWPNGATSGKLRKGSTPSELVYAVKHPDLKMRKYAEWFGKNQFGNFLDKDGFVHMIPRVPQPEE